MHHVDLCSPPPILRHCQRLQALGVETIDDMLDVVPKDLDDLRLKPIQSRRLQRAIEERRLKRAIEDIDVDDSLAFDHEAPAEKTDADFFNG